MRGRSTRSLVGGLMAAVLTVVATLGGPAGVYAQRGGHSELPGQDVCPEPNSSFESTCFLGAEGDVLGFLSQDGDIDIYRVEPLEFGVGLHVALLDQPFPYRMTLLNWRAEVLARSEAGGGAALDATLGPPGSYYIAVEQAFVGQVSPTEPYRLTSQLAYPAGVPEVRYSATFRPGGEEEDTFDTSTDEIGEYEIAHGKLTVKMHVGGSLDDPEYTGYWLPVDDMPNDFTLSLDGNVLDSGDSGYSILFRSPLDRGNTTGYEVIVSPWERSIWLHANDEENGDVVGLTDQITSDAINPTGPNRVVVRCSGDEIIINVNGVELAHVRDATFSDGILSFQAIAWSDQPPTVTFSNLLLTTP